MYTGSWLNDKAHGHGTLILPNGSIYEGQFEENMKSGYGNWTSADG